jgi:hypothetical protein
MRKLITIIALTISLLGFTATSTLAMDPPSCGDNCPGNLR